MTEYDLPRPTIEPHDVILDASGIAWYSNFGEQSIGKLDPKTGKVTECRVPEPKKGSPQGLLSLRGQMYTRAKKILASEFMYALGKDEEGAEAYLDELLEERFGAKASA